MIRRLVLAVVLAGGLVALVSGTASAVDCTVDPSDPSCATTGPTASPSPTDSPSPSATDTSTAAPTATSTATPTDTTTSTSTGTAPGVDTGVYVDPSTGSVKVDQNTGVAIGVTAWLASVCAGLATARAVLP